ncbi:hypothetical protein [Butyrivibrio sp. M55]|uniref:hypothetical protein n=1 Tax=Butyrivibrio sp. M55 TaxID=1855323 RepID=UPI0008F2042C|nr:hypothetical protein [Butyrivibrio sp. M55]SFU88520.1 hypothetical protein SAMN05216540_1176 [Butyrivibrio sp. M55]
MNLYHYYDKRSGPFKSLTALSNEEVFVYTPDFEELNPEPYYVVTAGLLQRKKRPTRRLIRLRQVDLQMRM